MTTQAECAEMVKGLPADMPIWEACLTLWEQNQSEEGSPVCTAFEPTVN